MLAPTEPWESFGIVAYHSVVVAGTGDLFTFGGNRAGHLGFGDACSRTEPKLLFRIGGSNVTDHDGTVVEEATAGVFYTLVRVASGERRELRELRAFGDNEWGQLGTGEVGGLSALPAAVALPAEASD